jgi:hypothetical protein
MAIVVLNGPFIQAGESLSDVVDCSAGKVVRITMPGQWTYHDLTFQISSDGLMFNNLVDTDGKEIKVVVVPNAGVIFPADWARSIVFIKFPNCASLRLQSRHPDGANSQQRRTH